MTALIEATALSKAFSRTRALQGVVDASVGTLVVKAAET